LPADGVPGSDGVEDLRVDRRRRGRRQGRDLRGRQARERDNGDPGIVGATLNLRGSDYLSAPVWLTTTTTLGGAYAFTNVRSGIYTVTEIQPIGYLDGKDKVGRCGGGPVRVGPRVRAPGCGT